jgi:hypothetical protein
MTEITDEDRKLAPCQLCKHAGGGRMIAGNDMLATCHHPEVPRSPVQYQRDGGVPVSWSRSDTGPCAGKLWEPTDDECQIARWYDLEPEKQQGRPEKGSAWPRWFWPITGVSADGGAASSCGGDGGTGGAGGGC